jgi:hypothetical protein
MLHAWREARVNSSSGLVGAPPEPGSGLDGLGVPHPSVGAIHPCAPSLRGAGAGIGWDVNQPIHTIADGIAACARPYGDR